MTFILGAYIYHFEVFSTFYVAFLTHSFVAGCRMNLRPVAARAAEAQWCQRASPAIYCCGLAQTVCFKFLSTRALLGPGWKPRLNWSSYLSALTPKGVGAQGVTFDHQTVAPSALGPGENIIKKSSMSHPASGVA